jgi:hypothetical protein
MLTAVANVAAVADIHCRHRRSLPSPMLTADAHCRHECCCRRRRSLLSPMLLAVTDAPCRHSLLSPITAGADVHAGIAAAALVAAIADVYFRDWPSV